MAHWPLPAGSRIQEPYTGSISNLVEVSLTSSAVLGQEGSWVGPAANIPDGVIGFWLQVAGTALNNTATPVLLDVGYGSTAVLTDFLAGYASGIPARVAYIPLRLPSGVGLRGRIAAQEVSKTCKISVVYNRGRMGMFGDYSFAFSDTFGADSLNSSGVIPALSATADTFGDWTEVVASTPRRLNALTISAQGSTASMGVVNSLIEVGVGAAGAEQTVLKAAPIDMASNETLRWAAAGNFDALQEVSIPVGSRLAIRNSMNSTTSGHRPAICVHGFGR